MMTSPVALALTALLLPAAAFLIIAALPPLRRSGRPAAWLSIGCALASLVSALLGWRAARTPQRRERGNHEKRRGGEQERC